MRPRSSSDASLSDLKDKSGEQRDSEAPSSYHYQTHAGPQPIPEYVAARRAAFPKRENRTLVLCFDGTGDQFDADNTNVVRLFEALKKSDPTQLIYYQSGIGTYSGRSQLKGGISSLLDMAVGSGLGNHVREGYTFLMQNYREGDKISLFGFSRGAYTARSLAGMLHKVGLLPSDNHQQVAFAYEMYKRDDDEGWRLAGGFKRTFAIDVSIHFLGVWDTVASVGFLPRATLPFSSSTNPSVKHFRQALALNEHRAKFKQNHWIEGLNDISTSAAQMAEKLTLREEQDSAKLQQILGKPILSKVLRRREKSGATALGTGEKRRVSLGGETIVGHGTHDKSPTETEEEKRYNLRHGGRPWKTDVQEVWFCGSHTDVGGGSVPNKTRHQLARIPLRWMLRACFLCDTDIIFSTKVLASLGLHPAHLYPLLLHREPPRTASLAPSVLDAQAAGELPHAGKSENPFLNEDAEDYFDALSPIYDMLKIKKGWWALEVLIPVRKSTQDKDGLWVRKTGPNWGTHRVVRDERPNLHYTVLLRQQEAGYKIQNEVDMDAEWNITM
ncbi:hypothetical protein T439DRAFT_328684 [Meredithblackwellia eburnea MCA 4105]